MSRSGYRDDWDSSINVWRGAVKRAVEGKRGQALLTEMLAAFDSMSEKKLITNDLERKDGCVCALGAVGKARGLDMSRLDPEDRDLVAEAFNIAGALAAEVAWVNDEAGPYWGVETPEARFVRVREWVSAQIKTEDGTDAAL